GRLPGALAMTADELARAIAASGVRDTARGAEAARAVAGWLARAPADEVAEGLAAAADPAAALDQLARLLPAAEAPPAPGRVAPLLRLLGGSPALAGALVAEGAAWPALVAAVHEVPARGPDAQRAALAVAGASGPLSRADLQAALRRHRRSRYGQARRRGAQLQLRRRPGLRLRARRRAGRGPHARAVLLAPRRGGDARARRGHGRRPRLPRGSPAPPGRRRGAGRRLAPGGALVLRGLGADVGARRVAEGPCGGWGPRPRRAAHRRAHALRLPPLPRLWDAR